MTVPAIEVSALRKQFDEVVAIDGIDLLVQQGQCVGLLGPNGAGKTTTIEILEGLQQPTSGTVRILGMSWQSHAAEIRERIGVQLQQTRFYERYTVEETLRLFAGFFRRGPPVDALVKLVDLEEKRHTYVSRLSGGQHQRLALATALAGDPEVLFLDEPTTGLDPQARRALWDAIERLKAAHKTVVLTTHYLEEAEKLCDRVVIVDHGRIVADDSPKNLIGRLGGAQMIAFSASPPLPAEALHHVPGLVEVRQDAVEMHLSVQELHRALPALLAAAAERGSTISRLTTHQATLDDVFLSLTGRSLRESNTP